MEDFEILQGRPYGHETLIPLPEMSYEQELLNIPVPFKNRIDFLSDYIKPHAKHLPLEKIAHKVGISENFAADIIRDIGASQIDEDGTYELYTLEVVEDELEWQQIFDELDDDLSAIKIANFLGKSERWVLQKAFALAVYPTVKFMPQDGREYSVYPKSTAWMLRTLLHHAPPSNALYTRTEMASEVNKDPKWITKQLGMLGIEGQLRTSALTNEVLLHYTEEEFSLVKSVVEALPPPAGNWLTAKYIEHITNRPKRWVKSRLSSYEALTEVRLDVGHQPHIHYPPEVLNALIELSNKEPRHAPEGWMTRKAIAISVGKSEKWIIPRIKQFEGLAGDYPDVTGKFTLHYPPQVRASISNLAG